ncbi:MAG: O-antigen ligase family protein [Candidatus Puniceispirillaceae bacterium]
MTIQSHASGSTISVMRAYLSDMLGNARAAFAELPKWERPVHLFWLAGPFILLIERSPADIWVTLLALVFAVRAIVLREGWWLRTFWVRAAFLFWAVCFVAAAASSLPLYSIGETAAWFRFPLFAMATAFWLGRDPRLLYLMILSTGVGMVMMCGILTAEVIIVGPQGGRLSWPYGDLVPGNYLAKVGLPAFVVAVAFATSLGNRLARVGGVVALLSIILSVLTGERINFLIRACSGMLASVSWKPKWWRVFLIVAVEVAAVVIVFQTRPDLGDRYVDNFIDNLPTHTESAYYRAAAPGVLAFDQAPVLGIGPGNLRYLCEEVSAGFHAYECHPHPHNFYIQLLGEAGAVGFVAGVLFMWSIIWTCAVPAIRDRSNVVVATMWIVPFGLFWPIASMADFFGQWNNIFMWSALAIALAGSGIGTGDRTGPQG